MNAKTIGAIVGVILLVLSGIGAYGTIVDLTSGRGGTSNLDTLQLEEDLIVVGDASVGDDFTVTGDLITGSITTVPASGTCADATTTLFALTPPFSSGTSTARVTKITGQNGTTSVDIMVGTSTTAYVPYLSNLSTALLTADEVATGTQFYLASGAVSNGAIANTGSAFIVVGPGQKLVAQATSSTAANSVGNSGVINPANSFACTYSVQWYQ